MFEVGSYAYLAREVTEPACGDHPMFLLGKKGERVKILGKDDHRYPYTVEGPTNPGKPWRAEAADMMKRETVK